MTKWKIQEIGFDTGLKRLEFTNQRLAWVQTSIVLTVVVILQKNGDSYTDISTTSVSIGTAGFCFK
jgi:hypothetical protein